MVIFIARFYYVFKCNKHNVFKSRAHCKSFTKWIGKKICTWKEGLGSILGIGQGSNLGSKNVDPGQVMTNCRWVPSSESGFTEYAFSCCLAHVLGRYHLVKVGSLVQTSSSQGRWEEKHAKFFGVVSPHNLRAAEVVGTNNTKKFGGFFLPSSLW